MRLQIVSTFALGVVAGVAGLMIDPWPAAAATVLALLAAAIAVTELMAADTAGALS